MKPFTAISGIKTKFKRMKVMKETAEDLIIISVWRGIAYNDS